MKKLAFISALLLLTFSLTACKKAPSGGLDTESSQPDIRGRVTYNGATSGETFLTGLDGAPIDVSEISVLQNKKYDSTTELSESDFGRAECKGIAYAYKPSFVISKESSPELFEYDEYIGKRTPPSSEFFKVKDGDKFGSLTVKNARTVFSAVNTNTGSKNYYEGSELELDGELTLTGWISIPSVDEKYPNVILDMEFYCDDTSLPLSVDFGCNEEYGYYHGADTRGGYYYADVPVLSLGKFPDQTVDMGGLKEGDYDVKVEITVTNIKMVRGIQGNMSDPTAVLTDIKRL